MRFTTRISQLFATVLVTILLFAAIIVANTTARTQRHTVANRTSAGNSVTTTISVLNYGTDGMLNPLANYAHRDDSSALRSASFYMPEPHRYVISTSPGYGQVRRKAPIRRKGQFQG